MKKTIIVRISHIGYSHFFKVVLTGNSASAIDNWYGAHHSVQSDARMKSYFAGAQLKYGGEEYTVD